MTLRVFRVCKRFLAGKRLTDYRKHADTIKPADDYRSFRRLFPVFATHFTCTDCPSELPVPPAVIYWNAGVRSACVKASGSQQTTSGGFWCYVQSRIICPCSRICLQTDRTCLPTYRAAVRHCRPLAPRNMTSRRSPVLPWHHSLSS